MGGSKSFPVLVSDYFLSLTLLSYPIKVKRHLKIKVNFDVMVSKFLMMADFALEFLKETVSLSF